MSLWQVNSSLNLLYNSYSFGILWKITCLLSVLVTTVKKLGFPINFGPSDNGLQDKEKMILLRRDTGSNKKQLETFLLYPEMFKKNFGNTF